MKEAHTLPLDFDPMDLPDPSELLGLNREEFHEDDGLTAAISVPFLLDPYEPADPVMIGLTQGAEGGAVELVAGVPPVREPNFADNREGATERVEPDWYDAGTFVFPKHRR